MCFPSQNKNLLQRPSPPYLIIQLLQQYLSEYVFPIWSIHFRPHKPPCYANTARLFSLWTCSCLYILSILFYVLTWLTHYFLQSLNKCHFLSKYFLCNHFYLSIFFPCLILFNDTYFILILHFETGPYPANPTLKFTMWLRPGLNSWYFFYFPSARIISMHYHIWLYFILKHLKLLLIILLITFVTYLLNRHFLN